MENKAQRVALGKKTEVGDVKTLSEKELNETAGQDHSEHVHVANIHMIPVCPHNGLSALIGVQPCICMLGYFFKPEPILILIFTPSKRRSELSPL